MITPGADLKVYIATRPVDFRKGHDGLAALVQQMFGLDPFSGAAFVFRAKRADRVKILVWDRTGLVLVHKRLEGCKFVWPQVSDGVMRIPWLVQSCTRPVRTRSHPSRLRSITWGSGQDGINDRAAQSTNNLLTDLLTNCSVRGGIEREEKGRERAKSPTIKGF
jgi:transposase